MNGDISQSHRERICFQDRQGLVLLWIPYVWLLRLFAQSKSCEACLGLMVVRRLKTFLRNGRSVGTMFGFSLYVHTLREDEDSQ